MARQLDSKNMLWCVVIALGNIHFGYFFNEINIFNNRLPCIYTGNGINGVDARTRYNYRVWAECITSLTASLSGVAAGYFVKIGRRKMLIIANWIVVISSAIMCIRSYFWMMIGRSLRGIVTGMVSLTIPLFINEIAPFRNKAELLGLVQFMAITGSFLAYMMALFIPPIDVPIEGEDKPFCESLDGKTLPWRIAFCFPSIIAIFQNFLLICFFKAESPSLERSESSEASNSSSYIKKATKEQYHKIQSKSVSSGGDSSEVAILLPYEENKSPSRRKNK